MDNPKHTAHAVKNHACMHMIPAQCAAVASVGTWLVGKPQCSACRTANGNIGLQCFKGFNSVRQRRCSILIPSTLLPDAAPGLSLIFRAFACVKVHGAKLCKDASKVLDQDATSSGGRSQRGLTSSARKYVFVRAV